MYCGYGLQLEQHHASQTFTCTASPRERLQPELVLRGFVVQEDKLGR